MSKSDFAGEDFGVDTPDECTGECCRVVSLADRWHHFLQALEYLRPSEASVVLGATPEEQKDDCYGEH